MTIDDRARLGFAAAEHYDSYRPSYPPEAIAYLREAARITARSTVVDLAAGTGLMTRLLPPVGRLIAVEPLPEMRQVLAARVPEAEVVMGAGEHTPLPAAVADAVVIAQAFHWFANSDAVEEIARILRPTGVLALVWNVRDSSDPFMERLYAVLAPHRQQSPGHDSTPWQRLFEAEDTPLRLTSEKTFSWQEPITLGHLKGRVLSTSYIALLDNPGQRAVMQQLETLVGSVVDEAPVLMKHRTEVHIARHRAYPRNV
jgi:SAM-dependent methyltransferase